MALKEPAPVPTRSVSLGTILAWANGICAWVSLEEGEPGVAVVQAVLALMCLWMTKEKKKP